MRKSFLCAALLATTSLAACSRHDEPRQTNESVAVDVAQDRAGAPAAAPPAMRVPGISPNAAPGVAFSYRYAFVLPDEAIAGVQGQHAAACEKLGPTQCRIIGMHYRLIAEDRVEAALQFKLAPELARQFGKDGIAAVEKARGKLVDAAIEGEDVGTQITDSQSRSAELKAELARIEARLAAGGIGDEERTELQQQAARLRQQLAGEQGMRTEGEQRLANTPMTYNYSGDAGFTLGGDPFGDAVHSAWGSFVTMISFVLLAIGVSLPWLALVALVVWLVRRWARRRKAARPVSVAPVVES
jgi:hypothetical protein